MYFDTLHTGVWKFLSRKVKGLVFLHRKLAILKYIPSTRKFSTKKLSRIVIKKMITYIREITKRL